MKKNIKTKKNPTFTIILGLICITMITIGGILHRIEMYDLEQNGKTTTGIIIDLKKRGTFKNSNSLGYQIECQYEVDGKTYEGKRLIGRNKTYTKGQIINVVYSKKNPNSSKAVLDKKK